MRAVAVFLLLLAISSVTACKKSATRDKIPTPPDAALQKVTEKDLRALLYAWLLAQNTADLLAYDKLYATHFTGVRRSGERTITLSRSQWLKDRARMFQRKMKVEAADVEVVAAARGGQISFTQTWESARYRDVGPKILVVVAEAGVLKIAREEMLASHIETPSVRMPAADAFSYVVHTNAPLVVLSDTPDESWANGPPALVSKDEVVVTRVAVDVSKLFPVHAAWMGRKVALLGPSGPVCQASVTGFALLGRMIPHLHMQDAWHEAGDEGLPSTSDTDIAAAAWDMTSAVGRVLVAELAVEGKPCTGAVWARAASLPALDIAKAIPAPPPLAELALAEFHKLGVYEQVQKDYWEQDEAPKDTPWENLEGEAPAIRLLAHSSGTRYLSVTARENVQCKPFAAGLWVLWELAGAADHPTLRLVNDPATAPVITPTAASDVDGDGVLELFFDQGLLRRAGPRYEKAGELIVPLFDCTC